MKKRLENNRGITLIALVITIIVLLILAGVTIASLNGNNGILSNANLAKVETLKSQFDENVDLATMGYNMSKEENRKEKLKQELGSYGYDLNDSDGRYLVVSTEIDNQTYSRIIDLDDGTIKNEGEVYIATGTMENLYKFYVQNDQTGYELKGNDVISIQTKEEMYYLAEYTNAGNQTEGVVFVLRNDIQLNDTSNYNNWESTPPSESWTPIGTEANPFQGDFEGQNYTISGIYLKNTETTEKYQGALFSYGKNCVIKDIELKDGLMMSSATGLAGNLAYGQESIDIENVKNYIKIKALGRFSYTAGIVNKINVNSDNSKVIIKDCANFVPVKYAIINYLNIGDCKNSEVIIENCYNTNNDTTNNIGGLIGEISAYVDADEQKEKIVQVKNCYNTGNITSSGIYAPVISGIDFSGKSQICVENCYNTGNITCTGSGGNTRVGGVVGTIYCDGPVDNDKKYGVIVKNCYNTGNIYGEEYIGGIVGDAELTNYYENFEVLGLWIQNCYNSGEISGQESVGGIAGEFVGSAIIENCYNVGKIEATQNAGGIAGYVTYGNEGDINKINNCYYLKEEQGINSNIEIYGLINPGTNTQYTNNGTKSSINEFLNEDFIKNVLHWGIYNGQESEENVWKLVIGNNPILWYQ